MVLKDLLKKEIKDILDKYGNKVVWLSNKKEIQQILEEV